MSVPLPPGWQMTNQSGSHAGPARLPDDDSSDDEGSQNGELGVGNLDIAPDSPGWEDMEEDTEETEIKDFFSEQRFPTAASMLEHCKSTHSFDFLGVCKRHELDFYNTIKLVNYIRNQAQQGNTKPDVSSPDLWADEKYLQPAMEDDSLLYCLDEVVILSNDGQEPVDFDERAAREAAKEQHADLETVEE